MSLKDTYEKVRNRDEAPADEKAIHAVSLALDDFADTLNERRMDFLGDIEMGVNDAEARKRLTGTFPLPEFDLILTKARDNFVAAIKDLSSFKSMHIIGGREDLCINVTVMPTPNKYELVVTIDPEKVAADSRVSIGGPPVRGLAAVIPGFKEKEAEWQREMNMKRR